MGLPEVVIEDPHFVERGHPPLAKFFFLCEHAYGADLGPQVSVTTDTTLAVVLAVSSFEISTSLSVLIIFDRPFCIHNHKNSSGDTIAIRLLGSHCVVYDFGILRERTCYVDEHMTTSTRSSCPVEMVRVLLV